MQKSLTYLLPLAALLIIAVVGFRWINNRPEPTGEVTENAQGIEISDLTGDESTPSGVVDRETVKLESKVQMAQGQIRYNEIEGDRIQFTVQGTMPELKENEHYQLWFEGDKGPKKGSRLIPNKGGYLSEGIVSSEFDTLKVVVSKETNDDNTIEEVVLEGNVTLNSEEDQQ